MGTPAKWHKIDLPSKRGVFAVLLLGGAVLLDVGSGQLGIKDFALGQTFQLGDVIQVMQLSCGAVFAWLAKEDSKGEELNGASDEKPGHQH